MFLERDVFGDQKHVKGARTQNETRRTLGFDQFYISQRDNIFPSMALDKTEINISNRDRLTSEISHMDVHDEPMNLHGDPFLR